MGSPSGLVTVRESFGIILRGRLDHRKDARAHRLGQRRCPPGLIEALAGVDFFTEIDNVDQSVVEEFEAIDSWDTAVELGE